MRFFITDLVVPIYEDSYLRSVEFFPVVNRLLRLLCQFLLHLRTSSKKDVVDESIFQKSQEDKDKAAHQVHVYGFDVGDLGQSLSQVCVDGCHGQDSGDACEVNSKSELESAHFHDCSRKLHKLFLYWQSFITRASFTDENAHRETTDQRRLFLSVDPFLRNYNTNVAACRSGQYVHVCVGWC